MRTKPQYNFEQYCSAGAPLKGERHSHVMKGKVKRYAKGGSAPRPTVRSSSVVQRDVHYGSGKRTAADAAELLGRALIKAGL